MPGAMEIAGSNPITGLKSLIDETLEWLQGLLEVQNKIVETGKKKFNINSHLQYVNIPTYNEILSSDKELRRLASLLFSLDEKKITFKKSLKISKNCSEIHVEVDNNLKFFYIKKSWEGAIKEAIGLEFNNLLTDVSQRYLCSKELVITERMFDALDPKNLYILKESPQYAFAYGAWEVFTTILNITDRKIKNVRWNGEKLANIDFGLVFYKGEIIFDSLLAVPRDNVMYEQGYRYALDFVLKKIHQNREKMKELLVNLNSSFCRNLPSHRQPGVPLKTMIKTLQKMVSPDFPLTLDPGLKQKELFSRDVKCFEGLVSVKGHLASSIFTTEGKILAQINLPGYEFEKICPSVVEIVNTALSSVAKAGLGKCNFVQVSAKKGVLFAMWAIEEKLVISSLFDIDVISGQAKMEMVKAVKKFVPVNEPNEPFVETP